LTYLDETKENDVKHHSFLRRKRILIENPDFGVRRQSTLSLTHLDEIQGNDVKHHSPLEEKRILTQNPSLGSEVKVRRNPVIGSKQQSQKLSEGSTLPTKYETTRKAFKSIPCIKDP
jgi:hypothetical protein